MVDEDVDSLLRHVGPTPPCARSVTFDAASISSTRLNGWLDDNAGRWYISELRRTKEVEAGGYGGAKLEGVSPS